MMRVVLLTLLFVSWATLCQSQSLQEDLKRVRQAEKKDSNARIDELVTEIAKLQQLGDLRKAIDQCDRAAALAFKSDAVGRAFELSLVGAELSGQRGNLIDAADRFERAAMRNSNDPRAVEAHHQAVLLLAKHYERTKDLPIADRLDKLLVEHPKKWPRSKYASEMAGQRMELLADQKEWASLLKTVHQVSKRETHYERSRELMLKAHAEQFQEALSKGLAVEKRNELLVQMSNDLEPMVLGVQRTWPLRWSKRQYEAARILAAGHLTRGEEGAKYVTTMLGVALRGTPPPTQSVRKRMITLAVMGWLLQDNEERAIFRLTETVDDAKQARSLIETTRRNLSETAPIEYPNQAKRLLATIETLEGKLTISHQQKIDALLASGQRREAIATQRQMAQNNLDSLPHQLALARLLASGNSTEELVEAHSVWQQIESRLPAGSDSWHESRLARIQLMMQIGKTEQAKKLLEISRLLVPVESGSQLAIAYDQCDRQLTKAGNP